MSDSKSNETIDKEKAILDGQLLQEVTGTRGWKDVVIPMLEARMYHAWVDPRGMSKDEFYEAELNLFYSRENARAFLEAIFDKIEASKQYAEEKEKDEAGFAMKI